MFNFFGENVRLWSHSISLCSPRFGTIHRCHGLFAISDDDETSIVSLHPIAFPGYCSAERKMVRVGRQQRIWSQNRTAKLESFETDIKLESTRNESDECLPISRYSENKLRGPHSTNFRSRNHRCSSRFTELRLLRLPSRICKSYDFEKIAVAYPDGGHLH